MVDTREVFAGLYADGRQPSWRARLDELLPDPSITSRVSNDEDDDGQTVHRTHNGAQTGATTSAATLPTPASPSKRKQPSSVSADKKTGQEGGDDVGPYYDEGADLEDEVWVTEKYLRHQPRPELPPDQKGGTAAQSKNKKKPQTRPEDWTSDKHDPLTRPRRSDAVLSCPCCFTPLCYDCQRHDVYVSQYRAMFVTDECSARLTEFRTYDGDQYHPVLCSICETEVGVFEPADELYHFFNVIPGN